MSASFIPTFLYVKQHTVTGKLYLGKTTKDPETYLGSGLHWKRHIKQHDRRYVSNIWYCLFLDQSELTICAELLSTMYNVIESDDWLNLKIENGLDGGKMKGYQSWNKGLTGTFKHTAETKQQMSKSRKGIPKSDSTKQLMSIAAKTSGQVRPSGSNHPNYNKKRSIETNKLSSLAAKNRPKYPCRVCLKEFAACHMTNHLKTQHSIKS